MVVTPGPPYHFIVFTLQGLHKQLYDNTFVIINKPRSECGTWIDKCLSVLQIPFSPKVACFDRFVALMLASGSYYAISSNRWLVMGRVPS